jgi:NAD(P)-dependent dehydrogenase (short-subunit alcohol dehydrogenase family)
MLLENRNAVLYGVGESLGGVAASALAEAGAKVFLTARVVRLEPSNIIDPGDITHSRAAKCFSRCGCDCGASWARHTSTSTSYAEPETVAGRIASGQP